MSFKSIFKKTKGQTAIEYMILMAAVVSIVLIGFRNYLPVFYDGANIYFNKVGVGIYGEPNRCGDGVCDPVFEDFIKCCADCGVC